jgi:hypothetical protein
MARPVRLLEIDLQGAREGCGMRARQHGQRRDPLRPAIGDDPGEAATPIMAYQVEPPAAVADTSDDVVGIADQLVDAVVIEIGRVGTRTGGVASVRHRGRLAWRVVRAAPRRHHLLQHDPDCVGQRQCRWAGLLPVRSSLDGEDLCARPLIERKARLATLLSNATSALGRPSWGIRSRLPVRFRRPHRWEARNIRSNGRSCAA